MPSAGKGCGHLPRHNRREAIRDLLAPGRALDVGRVHEAVALLAKRPRRLPGLMECLWVEDAGVANRAADVLERLTAGRSPQLDPERLASWKEALIGLLAEAPFNKLRWNLALTVPRIRLTKAEAQRVAVSLRTYLEDRSSIVKTAAMHGLAGLTRHDQSLLPEVVDLLRLLSRSGTPAMRARGRILLKRLEAGL
jgi:hypothetical protein